MILSEPAPAPRSRFLGLDAARVVATFAIVWTHVAEGQGHTHGWTALGRFGTSFYIIVAALFVVRGAERAAPRTFIDEVRIRATRLLKPFIVWSLVYGLYYGAEELSRGSSIAQITHWWGPFAGTAVHLWFLPFVFFWGVLAAWVTPRINRLPLSWLALGGLLTSLGVYWFCYRWLFFAMNRFWLWEYHLHRLDRWVDEIPPFLTATWGAILYYRSGRRTQDFFSKRLIPIAVIGVLGFFGAEFLYASQIDVIRSATGTDGRFMANVAALFLLGAFLAMEGRALVQRLAPLGRFTYLAFLAHMLVIEVFRGPVKFVPGYGTLWFSFLTSLVVFTLSLLLSRLIQRTKHLAFLRA